MLLFTKALLKLLEGSTVDQKEPPSSIPQPAADPVIDPKLVQITAGNSEVS